MQDLVSIFATGQQEYLGQVRIWYYGTLVWYYYSHLE